MMMFGQLSNRESLRNLLVQYKTVKRKPRLSLYLENIKGASEKFNKLDYSCVRQNE
ncbi:hypothetical protein SAMN05216365_10550 [Porphyromonadaceae bacterium NLAE-zl-C104]|nr:hypothetical protein SAMN05216365_10550 [Porphyromonadaceae bacterium NLAE-zl-C104]